MRSRRASPNGRAHSRLRARSSTCTATRSACWLRAARYCCRSSASTSSATRSRVAHRAQRLDISHLFSARQWVLLAAAAIAVVTPAVMWPSPLADDIAYADHFSPTRALAVSHDLAALERTEESAGAAIAARSVRDAIGGEIVPIIASVPRVQRLILSSGVHTLSLGVDLQGLSPSSSAVH